MEGENESTVFPDPFGLEDRRTAQVFVGSRQVRVKSGTHTNAINEIPKAEVTLDGLDPVVSRLNLAAEVEARWPSAHFVGSVISGAWVDDELRLKCSSYPGLEEPAREHLRVSASPTEQMQLLFRRSGGAKSIQGAPEETTELFEVLVPLRGIDVESSERVGNVSIVTADVFNAALDKIGWNGPTEQFNAAGVTYVSSSMLADAQEEGITRIREVLDWFTVNSRYSLPTYPDGRRLDWHRQHWTSVPEMQFPVVTRGCTTSRLLAVGRMGAPQTTFQAQHGAGRRSPALRMAASSFARAVSADSSIGATVAINEAIEFYVAGTKPEKLMNRSDRKRMTSKILECLKDDYSDEVRSAVEGKLSGINQAPLALTLQHKLAMDSVPYSKTEFDELWELRAVRNDLVHGRSDEQPSPELVARALAFVAKMLIFADSAASTKIANRQIEETPNAPRN